MEKNRGREETRVVKVYDKLDGINRDWVGIKTIIKVEREVRKAGVLSWEETAYYISSLSAETKAKEFNEGISVHWAIENSLHYVKDKTFMEDGCKIRTGDGAKNMSAIRNIIINIFRNNGFVNMAQSIRMVSNDIGRMWQFILE